MKKVRIALLAASLAVVLLFAGILTAGLTTKESLFQSLGNLAEVVHLVEAEYVDELDPAVLALALDGGILESVDLWAAVVADDEVGPLTTIFTEPPPYGLALTLRLGSAAVRTVFPGSPADDAGLTSWEVIEQIDGVYTRGRPLWQIALDLAGRWQRGETVTLTVLDREVDERREVGLVAREWRPVSATLEDLDDVRVLEISSLTRGAAAEIEPLVSDGTPLVLDLRGLVWGAETEALAVADLFVEAGTLAAWQGREAGGDVIAATPGATAASPMVLVDGETEAVGEILAAALQRAGAVLVGRPTMGHAPHMQLVRRGELNLWMPVGRWLNPADQPIHGEGLVPDDEVAPTDDEGEEGDPILEHALAKIRGAQAEAA
ncbi:MAG TPA: S41 family peptidase [Candidatus Sulfomarinibacteraceae bacterium]|nr:S41 family peptidase [Candidatus Sulfomarinibacteraceae bacterium]